MCDSTSLDMYMDCGVSSTVDLEDDTNGNSLLPSGPTLDNVPIEIFLHICSFLDGKQISESLRLVCKRFYNILNDDNLWKLFVHKLATPSVYPALPSILSLPEFSWEDIYIEMESEVRNWTKYKNKHYLTSVLRDVHYSDVDAIVLLNEGRICVSGSRDRGIAVWNVLNIFDETQGPPTPVYLDKAAHQGWVWDFTYFDRSLYSCSWDNSVKRWNLDEGLQLIDIFLCKRTVLSVVCDDKILAAGLYNSKVLLFDPRTAGKPIKSYQSHTRPVLSLVMTDNMILSGSEDRTLAVWDRRAGKIFKKNIPISSGVEYPMCMSMFGGSVYIGDNRGNIHLLDPTNLTVQPFHQKDPITENSRIVRTTGIKNGFGSVISCCDNGLVSVLYPTMPSKTLTSLRCDIPRASGLDYQNNILSVACESAVQLWIPKDHPLLGTIAI